jgi:hypothetical protein
VLLLALPVTVAIELLTPGHAEVVIHMLLATGTLIVAASVFHFAAPRWASQVGCAAACVLTAIFLLQALGALTGSDSLRNLGYSTALGGWGEASAVSVVMVWLIAVARTLGRGRGLTTFTGMLFGLLVIALSAWGTLAAAPTGGVPSELRLLFLLPVAWLLWVSTRRQLA